MPKEQDWPISVEMQFLAGLGDGNPRPTGNMCSPGTNIFYNGQLDTRHCINATGRALPKDAWVRAEVLVLGDSIVKHIINGDTVLVYDDTTFGRQRQFSVPDNETADLQDEIKAWLGSGHPIWYAFDRMQHEFAPIEREPYLPTSAADR